MSIIVENLSYTYYHGTIMEKQVLIDINLTINDGVFIGIIGNSGSGKSTLLQHFNGLIIPQKGKVIVNDISVNKKTAPQIRKFIGLVFQEPEKQFFARTVYDELAFGLKNLGISEENISIKIDNIISLIDLSPDWLNRSPYTLSDGQKRLVAIASILCMEPQILLLDEPDLTMDTKTRQKIFDLILALNKENGVTVVLVSKNMREIVRLVEQIIVINEGRIIFIGTSEELFLNEGIITKAGFKLPSIVKLSRQLKEFCNESVTSGKLYCEALGYY